KKTRLFAIIGSLTIVSCGTILLLWHKLLFSRVSDLSGSTAITNRETFNHFGLEVIKQNPILGTGAGNYIQTIQTMFHVQPWQYQPPHNIFIYIGASIGLVGLTLFFYLLWLVFRSTWNNPPSAWRFTLLVLGFTLLFMSMFDHFLVTVQQ